MGFLKQPDELTMRIVDGWAQRVRAERARELGFTAETSFEEIVRAHIEDELGGTITGDGKTLYFEKSAPPHYLYILFESHLKNGKWQKPSVLPFSGRYKDTDPVLSPDERTMLFASDRPAGEAARRAAELEALVAAPGRQMRSDCRQSGPREAMRLGP